MSEPAPILVIQVVKMSARLLLSGFWTCIVSSFLRKGSEADPLLSLSGELVWPSVICWAVKDCKCDMPEDGRRATILDMRGCHSA